MTPDIVAAAERHGVDAGIVTALIDVESNGNPYAWNPEPHYRYFWNVRTNAPFRRPTAIELASEVPPADFPCLAGDRDQEWWAQQTSWGLMQVMGAVAREHGFRGDYLPELTDVAVNLEYGCKHLARLQKWANGDIERALAAYNGGTFQNVVRPYRNAVYANKVLTRMKAMRRENEKQKGSS